MKKTYLADMKQIFNSGITALIGLNIYVDHQKVLINLGTLQIRIQNTVKEEA